MPIYSYECPACNLAFEVQRYIKDYRTKEKCPSCNKLSQRNFSGDSIHSQVRLHLSEIAKVGHYAARQTEMKSNDELNEMRANFKTKKQDVELPPGFSKLTKDEYIKMPSRRKR